jgi:hypothetical protein
VAPQPQTPIGQVPGALTKTIATFAKLLMASDTPSQAFMTIRRASFERYDRYLDNLS